MRFLLTLSAPIPLQAIPINYQYPLSAVIYKIIERADAGYAGFLHNQGYGEGLKHFKLFTFSDLKTAFRIHGDRLQLMTSQAELLVSFHLPEAATHFIKGLFLDQQIEIAG
jgi:CRISPR-associated endoribonuclease Cas6